eukprot:m.11437 g.11437  ORF g.11437 m.11437 type:complete len:318 (-) comp4440_c0_seq1:1376-2329(-)
MTDFKRKSKWRFGGLRRNKEGSKFAQQSNTFAGSLPNLSVIADQKQDESLKYRIPRSVVGSSLALFQQTGAEQISYHKRSTQGSDGMDDMDLQMHQFESRGNKTRPASVDCIDHIVAHPVLEGKNENQAPVPPPRRATWQSDRNAPKLPPRPDWMKIKNENRPEEICTPIKPYISNRVLRPWAMPRRPKPDPMGLEVPTIKKRDSGYLSSRNNSTSPDFEQQETSLEQTGQTEKNSLQRRRRPTLEPEAFHISASLSAVLDDIRSDMQLAGSWEGAETVSQKATNVQRVQDKLNELGVLPAEATAPEILAALLSGFA